jgi:zinc protease
MNLAFFEMLSQAEDYNQEVAKYAAVTAEDIQRVAKELFSKENSSTLFYKSKEKENAE